MPPANPSSSASSHAPSSASQSSPSSSSSASALINPEIAARIAGHIAGFLHDAREAVPPYRPPDDHDLDISRLVGDISRLDHVTRSNLSEREQARKKYFADRRETVPTPLPKQKVGKDGKKKVPVAASASSSAASSDSSAASSDSSEVIMEIHSTTAIHFTNGNESHFTLNGAWLEALGLAYSGWISHGQLCSIAKAANSNDGRSIIESKVKTQYAGKLAALADNVSFYPVGSPSANPDGITLDDAFKMVRTALGEAGKIGQAILEKDADFLQSKLAGSVEDGMKNFVLGMKYEDRWNRLLLTLGSMAKIPHITTRFLQSSSYVLMTGPRTRTRAGMAFVAKQNAGYGRAADDWVRERIEERSGKM